MVAARPDTETNTGDGGEALLMRSERHKGETQPEIGGGEKEREIEGIDTALAAAPCKFRSANVGSSSCSMSSAGETLVRHYVLLRGIARDIKARHSPRWGEERQSER